MMPVRMPSPSALAGPSNTAAWPNTILFEVTPASAKAEPGISAAVPAIVMPVTKSRRFIFGRNSESMPRSPSSHSPNYTKNYGERVKLELIVRSWTRRSELISLTCIARRVLRRPLRQIWSPRLPPKPLMPVNLSSPNRRHASKLRRFPVEWGPASPTILPLQGVIRDCVEIMTMATDRISGIGFQPPVRHARPLTVRRLACAELLMTVTLTLCIVVAVIAVSLGIARADTLDTIVDGRSGALAFAAFLALFVAGMGGVTAAVMRRTPRKD